MKLSTKGETFMKTNPTRTFLTLFLILLMCLPVVTAKAQGDTEEITPTPTRATDRPLVVITSYYLNKDTIVPGDNFSLFLSIENQGEATAHNLIFTFTGEDFLPKETGGVVVYGALGAHKSDDISQPLLVESSAWGKTNSPVTVTLSYSGPDGAPYTETFTVTLEVLGWSGNWATATPTPTGTAMPRAQLVVKGYTTDIDPLQPGSMFNLDLDVQNLGNGDAREVTMVLGGGATPSMAETPSPGGVSGGGADLTTFAPLGSSNLQYLGDVAVSQTVHASQKLIVNVTANPGAYSLKLSFLYTDAKGNRQVDDQVITLLIYQIPQIEVNYYRDPGPIMAMQPNTLPIQVVNLGRKPTVMGNMTVTAEGADLMNNVSLVGTLDAGGYFPLDVMLIPQVAGPVDVKITINYTDDFNQARSIEQVMHIEVMEGAPMDPGMGPGMDPGMGPGMDPSMNPGGGGAFPGEMPVVEETFWDKALRFVKGLVGLDSGVPEPAPAGFPGEMPGEMMPGQGEPMPVPVNPGGKG